MTAAHPCAAAFRHLLALAARRRLDRFPARDGVRACARSASSVTVVNADPAPAPQFMAFPGVRDIQIAPTVDGDFDAAIIMECSDSREPASLGSIDTS